MKFSGKTSWGADWTYNDPTASLHICQGETNSSVYIFNTEDIFEESIPMTLEQRREVYILMESAQKLLVLVTDINHDLYRLQKKVANLAYMPQLNSHQDSDMHEKAGELARKISDLLCNVLNAVSN